MKSIFILTFGTDAYSNGGDNYYFSTHKKAFNFMIDLAKQEGQDIFWMSSGKDEYQFGKTPDLIDLYCRIDKEEVK